MLKRLVLQFQERLSIVLLVVYAFGYIYTKVYYWYFNITIEKYFDITDLLFYGLNAVLKLFLIVFSVEIITYFIFVFSYGANIRQQVRKKYGEPLHSREWTKQYDIERRLGFKIYKQKYKNFEILPSFLVFLFYFIPGIPGKPSILVLICLFFLLLMIKIDSESVHPLPGGSREMHGVATICCFSALTVYAITTAIDVKEGIVNDKIEFMYEEHSYSTNDGQYVFVGETINYLFIYDKVCKQSKIFSKDDVTDFKINVVDYSGLVMRKN